MVKVRQEFDRVKKGLPEVLFCPNFEMMLDCLSPPKSRQFQKESPVHQKHANKMLHLGLNIAYYRKLRSLTQEELADMVGISRTHMGNIEAPNMDKGLSLETLFDISDALNVPPAKLLEIRE